MVNGERHFLCCLVCINNQRCSASAVIDLVFLMSIERKKIKLLLDDCLQHCWCILVKPLIAAIISCHSETANFEDAVHTLQFKAKKAQADYFSGWL